MADIIEVTEEDYNSASDDDFNPDIAAPTTANNEESSSSEDEPGDTAQPRNSKRKAIAEDVDFDNSGDEATIKKARRKKRKDVADDDDEGGEGGLIMTRAQRRAAVEERKPLVDASNSSLDVDALWAQMAGPKKEPDISTETPASPPISHPNGKESNPREDQDSTVHPHASAHKAITSTNVAPLSTTGEPTITIKRTYEFAGETLTEERSVPASSAEARLYLEEQARQQAAPAPAPSSSKPGLRRPKKRTSMFGPGGIDTSSAASTPRGPKLTTLEKSKLDWAQHVDEEGITEELDEHRRAKEGYLGRMDFLGRMDMKKEEVLEKVKPK